MRYKKKMVPRVPAQPSPQTPPPADTERALQADRAGSPLDALGDPDGLSTIPAPGNGNTTGDAVYTPPNTASLTYIERSRTEDGMTVERLRSLCDKLREAGNGAIAVRDGINQLSLDIQNGRVDRTTAESRMTALGDQLTQAQLSYEDAMFPRDHGPAFEEGNTVKLSNNHSRTPERINHALREESAAIERLARQIQTLPASRSTDSNSAVARNSAPHTATSHPAVVTGAPRDARISDERDAEAVLHAGHQPSYLTPLNWEGQPEPLPGDTNPAHRPMQWEEGRPTAQIIERRITPPGQLVFPEAPRVEHPSTPASRAAAAAFANSNFGSEAQTPVHLLEVPTAPTNTPTSPSQQMMADLNRATTALDQGSEHVRGEADLPQRRAALERATGILYSLESRIHLEPDLDPTFQASVRTLRADVSDARDRLQMPALGISILNVD